MYYLDDMRDKDGADIYRTSAFSYPLSRDRKGRYKIQSGEKISVCMTSDFFLEEADEWRPEAWNIMRMRSDVIFILVTKRPQRIADCLPSDWGSGWPNIILNVTCENQKRTDERMPLLLELPFRHKGVYVAPVIGPVKLGKYLDSGQIEQVVCGGENYGGRRPCCFDWVKSLREECEERDITFCFMETGTVFIKNGKKYELRGKRLQTVQAFRSGMNYQGRLVEFELTDTWGLPVPEEQLYVKHYRGQCRECAMRLICNGCSDCGKCENR
jgi:protein gp37